MCELSDVTANRCVTDLAEGWYKLFVLSTCKPDGEFNCDEPPAERQDYHRKEMKEWIILHNGTPVVA